MPARRLCCHRTLSSCATSRPAQARCPSTSSLVVEIAQKQFNWRQMLVTFGPGLVVMLADTEVGSVITATQSGAKWGYRLLLLQVLVVPLLYTVQELAA